MQRIKYKTGYKYQLYENFKFQTNILKHEIASDYIVLHKDGLLKILKGYAWDGPSGPAIDTKTFMRGSLVHDALYQLMREGLLPLSYKNSADKIMHEICLKDGMNKIRAWWCYRAVYRAAGPAADPENIRKIQCAP